MEAIENKTGTRGLELTVIDRGFVITRILDAPRAMVYKVWTDAAHFAKWWGPHAFTNPGVSSSPMQVANSKRSCGAQKKMAPSREEIRR